MGRADVDVVLVGLDTFFSPVTFPLPMIRQEKITKFALFNEKIWTNHVAIGNRFESNSIYLTCR